MTDQPKIPEPEPVAQVQRMGSFQGVPHYGCLLTMVAERRMKVNDPLYGSAELETYAAAREAAARQEERERCARVCDDEARIRTLAGDQHPEDSESRGRCYAAARAAINCAKGIRNGEEIPSSAGDLQAENQMLRAMHSPSATLCTLMWRRLSPLLLSGFSPPKPAVTGCACANLLHESRGSLRTCSNRRSYGRGGAEVSSGYTDGGRNPYFEGAFDGESPTDAEARCALVAERDKYRDALIACRPHVMADLTRYERLAERFSGPSRVALDEESARISALLDTIDAAAKGQG
jgi:hypothetical protein